MNKLTSTILLAVAAASSGVAGGISFLNAPGTPIDTVNWNSVGADQALFSSGVTVDSALGNTITVGLGTDASLGGLTSVVCAASNPTGCSWGNQPSGYDTGDTLLWLEGQDSNNNVFGTGPVTYSFANDIGGLGDYIQATAPGQFTATLTLYDVNTLLGSETWISDSSGDPLFVGALDTAANISNAVIGVNACGLAGCDVNDFTADTLQIYGPSVSATPEPGTFVLAGTMLAAGLFGFRKRFAKGKR